MIFQEFFAKLFQSEGWTLFAPGERLPPPTQTEARAVLEAAGCTILLPGQTIPPTLETARAVLESQRAIVVMPGEALPFDVDAAIAGLKERHYTVMRPVEAPELGLWEPLDRAVHLPRTVTAVDWPTVHFISGGERDHTPVLSFWKWRKHADAKHRPVVEF